MRIRDFKALTFDCYGTLIDWERGLLDFLRPWAESVGRALSDSEILACFGRYESTRQVASPAKPYTEILSLVLGDIARELGVGLAEGEARRLPESLALWPPFADATEALRELGGTHALVVVSNVDRALFSATQKRLGVDFDAVVTAEDVGCYKPDPAVFQRVLEVLGGMGIDRGEILHVAQSLFHDHLPAKRLGLATVWIDRRRGQPGWGATPPPAEAVEPDLVLGSLGELVELNRREGEIPKGESP